MHFVIHWIQKICIICRFSSFSNHCIQVCDNLFIVGMKQVMMTVKWPVISTIILCASVFWAVAGLCYANTWMFQPNRASQGPNSYVGWHGLDSCRELKPLCHSLWHWAGQCTDKCAFILLCLAFFSWNLSDVIGQGFNSSCEHSTSTVLEHLEMGSQHEHPTATVLEHLESGPWPGLGHMCWPGAWAVIIAFV